MTQIDIDLEDPETLKLWAAVSELVERLPGQWVLIGGLMVQLHAVEHGVTDVRPTSDIDVLGQARPPGAQSAIHAALRSDDFELVGPDLDGYAHRYERDGLIVDVLAPDGVVQAMVLTGDEDRDAPALPPPADPPIHLEARGDISGELRPQALAVGPVRQEELGAHEEPATARVRRVLVGRDDVRAPLEQKARHRRDDPRTVGAADQQTRGKTRRLLRRSGTRIRHGDGS
jgi:hypothetical protein